MNSSRSSTLVTDEMVARAAEAAWRAWPGEYDEPSWAGLKGCMRAALEAVQGDIVEEFGASGGKPCACHTTCGDVPEEVDDSGTCKGLKRAPEPPLVEFVTVHRSEVR